MTSPPSSPPPSGSVDSIGLTFHHVGVACRDIEREVPSYLHLGFEREGMVFEDPAQRIRGLFLTLGSYRVELLQALVAGEPSPLDTYLRQRTKLYHEAFLADDLELASAHLVDAGAIVSVPPVPAVAFDGRRITFLMQRNMNLIELIEGA
jgi:methylmalonyl-CoA/ethylmalonyl-CoA epimerase